MNYYQAHEILNAVKDNASYNLSTINMALELTGDLDIAELSGKTSATSNRYGSKEWLDGLCQGKSART
jgi:hypothetical protein